MEKSAVTIVFKGARDAAVQMLRVLYLVCLMSMASFLHAQAIVEPVDAPAAERLNLRSGPLHKYVAQADDSFGYELAESGHEGQCSWLRFNVTSQTWQGIRWRHVVWIFLPTSNASIATKENLQVTGDSAVLFIGGGSWKNDWSVRPPQNLALPREFGILSLLAANTQSPVVLVEQVPFQPILDGRFEDAIIAETFRRYIMGEGEDWPLLLPMVKSAVRIMDVAQQQLKERFALDIKRFTVSGASKRGWTTWLSAAADSRVDAIAPIVIDMLNMPAQMQHQMETWGKYSDEIADYTNLELQKHLSTPRGQSLQQIVDPYSYREILDLPKLLIFATNDRYWTLDACNIYWNDLVGPKNVLYIPNNGHGIKDLDRVVAGLGALHRARKENKVLPEVQWAYSESKTGNGKLVVTLDDADIESCTLWIAKTAGKDFRNANWISIPMFEASEATYAAPIDYSDGKNIAFFGEVVIKDGSHLMYLSSNITLINPKTP